MVALPKTYEAKDEHEHAENNANQDFRRESVACRRGSSERVGREIGRRCAISTCKAECHVTSTRLVGPGRGST